MPISIVEIKARCTDSTAIRKKLVELNSREIGEDHQIDTYFQVPTGRLKLRRGNIENTLIQYERPNQSGPKLSSVSLYKPVDANALYNTLSAAIPVLVEVDKKREIFFIDNVKFHIDTVKHLGSFVEIEAIDETGKMSVEKLDAQCAHFLRIFGIEDADLMTHSYSDMILERNGE